MSIYEMYDGDIELSFDDKKHVYTVDGKKVLSVTGITGIVDKSGPLMWWAVQQCVDYVKNNREQLANGDEVDLEQFYHDAQRAHLRSSKKAADIGTLTHRWIEHYFEQEGRNIELPANEKMRSSVESFLGWLDEHEVEPVETEFKVYSREFGYAGTCDMDAWVDGERCIVDWKTGSRVYPEHRLQTVAYQIAREEELDSGYDARWVVVLPKDGGKVVAKRFDDYETDAEGFIGALSLTQAVKKK